MGVHSLHHYGVFTYLRLRERTEEKPIEGERSHRTFRHCPPRYTARSDSTPQQLPVDYTGSLGGRGREGARGRVGEWERERMRE